MRTRSTIFRDLVAYCCDHTNRNDHAYVVTKITQLSADSKHRPPLFFFCFFLHSTSGFFFLPSLKNSVCTDDEHFIPLYASTVFCSKKLLTKSYQNQQQIIAMAMILFTLVRRFIVSWTTPTTTHTRLLNPEYWITTTSYSLDPERFSELTDDPGYWITSS